MRTAEQLGKATGSFPNGRETSTADDISARPPYPAHARAYSTRPATFVPDILPLLLPNKTPLYSTTTPSS